MQKKAPDESIVEKLVKEAPKEVRYSWKPTI
jgi:hypothetical protein